MQDKQELHNFIDADTLVVQASVVEQDNYMVYDKDGNKLEPTPSKKQWVEKNQDKDPSHYTFKIEPTLKQGLIPPLSRAKATFKRQIAAIEKKFPDHKHWICVEGEGNFREDLYPNYKGTRENNAEILLREELNAWVIQYFGKKVIVANGCETDDIVATYMWQGYKNFLKTGIYNYMVSSCDKDLRTVAGRLYNYKKDDMQDITPLEADRWYCTQLLYGDNIDGVVGLNAKIPNEWLKERGVKGVSGKVGVGTATALLENCKTAKECFEVVVECYKLIYKDNWLGKLQQEAIALRMEHYPDEHKEYTIKAHMAHHGVSCE